MKKSILALFMIAISLISCDSDDETPTPVVAPAIFEYAEGGEPSMRTISGNNGTTNVIEINLANFLVGTYNIGVSNSFKYTRPGSTQRFRN